MSFNDAQIQAINHFKGPALVLAGPGSGKTTVITHRIKKLITDYNVSPEHILVITFTKMAANEMKSRYSKLMGQAGNAVTFGTFHAVFFTILKHAYQLKAENIIRQDQQIDFIKRLLDHYELDITDKNEYATQILSEIGKVKNDRLPIEEYVSNVCPQKVFQSIYHKLSEMMKKYRLIDFDDMMIYCYELLEKRPALLNAWRDKYQFILIDEFQDICKAQFDVIRQIAEVHQNIFVVGDDDQSIYGFRGARPDIMLSFEHIFPTSTRVNMNTNYRSTSCIVDCAKSVIEHNQNRFSKEIATINPKGNKVQVYEFNDLEEENKYLINQLVQWKADGKNYSDCAILTRTNACADTFIKHLIDKNISFVARETIKCVFTHWIWLDIACYINVACGNRNRSDIFRIMNKPIRYISRESMPTPQVDFKMVRMFYSGKEWMQQRIDDLLFDLRMIRKLKPFAAINYIRRGVAYEDYLRSYAREHHVNCEDLLETLDEIQESAKQYETYEQWFKSIDELKEKLAEHNEKISSGYKRDNSKEINSKKNNLEENNKLEKNKVEKGTKENNLEGNNLEGNNTEEKKDAVNICTMHSCKGLEFDLVFIVDVVEGMTPYHKALLEEELEEERRMFYVAMTRAKKQLNICFVDERYNKTVQMSRFIEEMDKRYVDLHLLQKDNKK